MAKRRTMKKTMKRSKRSKGVLLQVGGETEEEKQARRAAHRAEMRRRRRVADMAYYERGELENPPRQDARIAKQEAKQREARTAAAKKFKKSKKGSKKKSNWMTCLSKARKELGIKGFVTINKGKDGKALYKRAKELQGK